MLLGRERELAAIERALTGARAGESAVLAIVGEPGIGKTALLDAAAGAAADAGMRTLRARGVQSEAQIPFAALFELLRPALHLLPQLPAPQAAALERALALRPGVPGTRFAVGAATLSLLAASADERPLAVLVDDLQWLDGSSADALLFAVRRLLAEPIAVVLAGRELDDSGLTTLRLGGIDVTAATELVGDAGARLHAETGGNPLALLELAREGVADVPPGAPLPVVASVGERYAQRAAALPEQTRTALVLASAADRGDPALFDRAAREVGVTAADLDAAVVAGLLETLGGRLEFRHPLARSAVYAAAPPDLRRRVHRALAQALPDADADRRAWHLALAATGADDTAASALAQAGGRAVDRSAYDVAAQAFERAAALTTADEARGAMLTRAADAAWLAGLHDRATSLLDAADRIAPSVEADHLRGRIALRRGPLAAALAVLRGPGATAAMLADAAEGALFAADTRGLVADGARARAAAAREGTAAARFFGAAAAGIADVVAGAGDAGAASIRDAAGLLEGDETLRDDPRLLTWWALRPIWLREDAAHERIDAAVAVARERSAIGVLAHLLTYVAIHGAATDRWFEAHAAFEEAIALAHESGQRVVLAGALARLSWLDGRRGRESDARAHADAALSLARATGARLCEIWTLHGLVELELVLGNLDAALERSDGLQRLLDELGFLDADVSTAPERVEVLRRLGRDEEADLLAAAYAEAAEAKGQPWALARAARARGAFDQALALHELTADLFERARTDLAYGASLRRDGRRVDARVRLRAALAAFERLGAAPWAETAAAELAATGLTVRRRAVAGVAELTPQELQVSLLLAAGRTTKETAAALFLSPKTIEYHLRNTYRKLGINTRDELRRALDEA